MKMIMKNRSYKYDINRPTTLDKKFGKILTNYRKLDKNKKLCYLL